MKIKIKANRFREIVMSAQEEPDLQHFLVAYGLPLWIFEEVTDDEQEAIQIITQIHRVANMTPQALIAAAGMNQTTFSRRFGIPRRTVQEWCGGRRQMPEYLKNMAAELLGLLNKIELQ